jgi:hypothetical protein
MDMRTFEQKLEVKSCTKLNPTNEIGQLNVLWDKCPRSKPVDALLNAYHDSPANQDLRLRWQFKVVEKGTLLSSLITTIVTSWPWKLSRRVTLDTETRDMIQAVARNHWVM